MAAENAGDADDLGRGHRASMRPRRMAAENSRPSRPFPRADDRFNEAAAHGRGKRERLGGAPPRPAASMRPRRMAAENAGLLPQAEKPAPLQ